MKLDLTKYTGYYYLETQTKTTIVLIRPEWWIPNKKLTFPKIESHFIRDGRQWYRYNISQSFYDALRYIQEKFNKV
jgi:hypothetical protein